MTCPKCGQIAPIRNGTYNIVNSVVSAFQGASKENIERFRDIAVAVQSGQTSPDQASQQIAQLGQGFESVWNWLNVNGTAMQTVVAIIALFLMIYYQDQSDQDNEELQAATQNQIVAMQSIEKVEQKILGELQKQNAPAAAPVSPPRPNQQLLPPYPLRTQVTATQPNRHERRKAKSLDRRRR